MADDPPLSINVPETTTVDLGVDKAQLGNLKEAFDDFWEKEDKKIDAAPPPPEAPGEGPAQETKEASIAEVEPKGEAEAKREAAPKREASPAEKPKAESERELKPEGREYSDEEIAKLELSPNAWPKTSEQFKKVKEMLLSERAAARELAKQRDALDAELAQARQNALTPELKADYENATWFRRRADLSSDPAFIQRFHIPVLAQYEAILEEAVGMLPNRQAAIEWAQDMKEHYRPDQLSKDWWTQSVVDKVPSELDKSTLRDSISKLLRLQKERDSELARYTQDQPAYERFKIERDQLQTNWVTNEIKAEIAVQEQQPYIKELLPRDPEKAKTAEERKAIEAHNELFNKYNAYFMDQVKDAGATPRGWVRLAIQATRAMILGEEVERLGKELSELKTERDQLKGELDKIHGVRRKITHTSGTPPAGAEKRNNNQGLSIKELDVRRAFNDYDW